MKITVLEANSKRPLANTKIQLQVKGKDSGFLTLTTDASGNLTLDNKYNGQQILATNSANPQSQSQGQGQQQWTTASEGARLFVTMAGSKQKETTQGGHK